MRDPAQMRDTFQAIKANGGVAYFGLYGCLTYCWQAGRTKLNGSAVRDLVNDGWLEESVGEVKIAPNLPEAADCWLLVEG